jgi:hypothetical protein
VRFFIETPTTTAIASRMTPRMKGMLKHVRPVAEVEAVRVLEHVGVVVDPDEVDRVGVEQ